MTACNKGLGVRRPGWFKAVLLGTASAFVMSVSVSAQEATKPAVAATNGKVDLGAGAQAGRIGASTAGSLALPLTHSFGLQADGLLGRSEGGITTGGAALQGFWRDPDRALVGAFASYVHDSRGDGRHATTFGPVAEIYLDRFSIVGAAGVQYGDVVRRYTSSVDLLYYPNDNFVLSLGHRYGDTGNMAAVGGEAAIDGSATTLFAESRIGADSKPMAWAGLRFYFGSDVSLMRRHREEDPPNRLFGDLFSFSTSQDTVLSQQNNTPPPTVQTGGGGEL